MEDSVFRSQIDKALGVKPSVLICTPFYQRTAFVNYLQSMISTTAFLTKMEIPFETLYIAGDSYVDRARNSMVASFLNEEQFKKYDRLFFIDSDMGWDVEGFLRMIHSPYDFTGAAYPMKNNWGNFSVKHYCNPNGTPLVTEEGMIPAEFVPGGFLCLTRHCLEKMAAAYFNNSYIDESAVYKKETVNLFECRIYNGGRQGEDSTFCTKWTDIGGMIVCEPRISFTHCGTNEWSGNYHEFLLKQPKPEAK